MSNVVRIGFTGTRHGMTREQVQAVYAYMLQVTAAVARDRGLAGIEGHHGDCLGADAGFHVLATALGWVTHAHPPSNPRLRAYCKADVIWPPKDYLARDYDIAQVTGELLAAPESPVPVPGSGTWATTGYAVRDFRHPAKVFRPDGTRWPGSMFFPVPAAAP